MSGFWERKLGTPQQAPPPQQPSSQAWWQPQPVPQPQSPVMQQPVYQQPQDELQGRKLPKSAGDTDRCPNCHSGDYTVVATAFTQRGQVETKRCFDCGFPKLHEFSGMTGTTDVVGGKAQQVAHAGGNVHNFAAQQLQAPSFAAEHGGPGR